MYGCVLSAKFYTLNWTELNCYCAYRKSSYPPACRPIWGPVVLVHAHHCELTATCLSMDSAQTFRNLLIYADHIMWFNVVSFCCEINWCTFNGWLSSNVSVITGSQIMSVFKLAMQKYYVITCCVICNLCSIVLCVLLFTFILIFCQIALTGCISYAQANRDPACIQDPTCIWDPAYISGFTARRNDSATLIAAIGLSAPLLLPLPADGPTIDLGQ